MTEHVSNDPTMNEALNAYLERISAIDRPRLHRFREAYLMMAKEARYRPQAPSDGFGHIQLSTQELADPVRLEEEATQYAIAFDREENSRDFYIGCSDFRTNRAFIFAIETVRVLASGSDGNATAIKLLKLAMKELES